MRQNLIPCPTKGVPGDLRRLQSTSWPKLKKRKNFFLLVDISLPPYIFAPIFPSSLFNTSPPLSRMAFPFILKEHWYSSLDLAPRIYVGWIFKLIRDLKPKKARGIFVARLLFGSVFHSGNCCHMNTLYFTLIISFLLILSWARLLCSFLRYSLAFVKVQSGKKKTKTSGNTHSQLTFAWNWAT